MADVVIRQAGADDALLVAALHLQSARDLAVPPEPGYLDRVAGVWLSERPDRPTWIAQSGGSHAGLLEARRIRPLPWPRRPDSSWLHIGLLFVAPDHRGRGVGRALVEAAVEWCCATDVTRIRLAAPDAAAKEFYERLGFTAPGGLLEYDLRGRA